MQNSAVPFTSIPRPRARQAFTLIELLVVIAVIAILAALLLPSLAAGKRAGLSAACKSDLHQLGLALGLYTSEFQKYPVCAESSRTGPGYALWEGKILPFLANNRNVFLCPANRPAPIWTNNPMMAQRNPSYGYNMAGSGRYPNSAISLGLDGGSGQGVFHFLAENQVKAPSDMIAMADCKPRTGGSDNDLDDLFPINLLVELAPRHNNGENVVFCDAHVDYGKHTAWLQKSDTSRRRWNNDHAAHPETWVNN